MAPPVLTMNNGKTIPVIGLGTWRSPPSVMETVIKEAIHMGYRHFDCAHIYGNEYEIGAALENAMQDGVVERSDIFITSKLWNTDHHPENVRRACETSMNRLKVDYLDLYLIHWPMGFKDGSEPYPKDETGRFSYSDVDFLATWKAMETLVTDKLCESIGLSNFNIQQIGQILKYGSIKPQVLQAESHPYLAQLELLSYCKKNNIVFTAYSSLGSGHTPYTKPGDYRLLEHPVVKSISERLECTPAQVLLCYQTQRGNVVIPRSIDKTHLEVNLSLDGIKLTNDDIKSLNDLDMGEDGRIVRMETCRDHPFYPFGDDMEQSGEF